MFDLKIGYLPFSKDVIFPGGQFSKDFVQQDNMSFLNDTIQLWSENLYITLIVINVFTMELYCLEAEGWIQKWARQRNKALYCSSSWSKS